jgi:hypothetical protein
MPDDIEALHTYIRRGIDTKLTHRPEQSIVDLLRNLPIADSPSIVEGPGSRHKSPGARSHPRILPVNGTATVGNPMDGAARNGVPSAARCVADRVRPSSGPPPNAALRLPRPPRQSLLRASKRPQF